jgi:hypothetical protein
MKFDDEAVEERELPNGNFLVVRLDDDQTGPREGDTVGILTTRGSHKNYDFTDKNAAPISVTDYGSWDEFDKALKEEYGAVIVIPVYMYEHSGLRMSTASFNDKWDSGRIGTIYTTKERIKEFYGHVDSESMKKARATLREEIQVMDLWVSGEVYTLSIRSPEGDILDGPVGGFYGKEGIDAYLLDNKTFAEEPSYETASKVLKSESKELEKEEAEAAAKEHVCPQCKRKM